MLHHPLVDDIELRGLEPWQAPELAAYVDRRRAYLGAWLPLTRLVSDVESARRFLASYAESQARDEARIYGLWRGGALSAGRSSARSARRRAPVSSAS